MTILHAKGPATLTACLREAEMSTLGDPVNCPECISASSRLGFGAGGEVTIFPWKPLGDGGKFTIIPAKPAPGLWPGCEVPTCECRDPAMRHRDLPICGELAIGEVLRDARVLPVCADCICLDDEPRDLPTLRAKVIRLAREAWQHGTNPWAASYSENWGEIMMKNQPCERLVLALRPDQVLRLLGAWPLKE